MDLQENTSQTNRLRLFAGFDWNDSDKPSRHRRGTPGSKGKHDQELAGLKTNTTTETGQFLATPIAATPPCLTEGVQFKVDLTPEPALYVAPNLLSWATIAPRSLLPAASLNVVFTSRGDSKPRRCRRLTRDVYDDIVRQCHEMEGRWRAQDGTVTAAVYQAMCERVAIINWHVERHPFA